MSYSAGTAWLQVIPSFRHIDQQLGRQVKQLSAEIDRGLKDSIPDAMRRGMQEGSRRATADGQSAGKNYGGAFAESLRRRVGTALKDLPPAEIGVARDKLAQDMKDVRNELDDVLHQHINLEIDDDTAIAKIESIRKKLKDLERSTNDRASVVNLRAAGGNLDAFDDLVKQARRSGREAGGNFGGAFGAEVTREFDKVVSSLPDIPVGADKSPFDGVMRAVRTELIRLKDFRIGIDGDAAAFFARVRAVQQQMETLRRENVSIPFNFDLDQAGGKLQDFLDKAVPEQAQQSAERTGGIFSRTLVRSINGALEDLPVVDLQANPSPALQEIDRIRTAMASIRDLHITGKLDAEEVMARLAVLQERLRQMSREDVDIQVRADTAAATVKLAAVGALAGNLDDEVAQIGNAAQSSMGRLGAMIAAGLSLGTTLVPAAAAAAVAVGSIATAAAAAGAGLGVLVLGFSGVVSGVTALHKYTQDADKSRKSFAQSQNAILSAQNSLTSAEASLSNARRTAASQAVAGQRRITDAVEAEKQARTDGAKAVKDAVRQQADAEKDLTHAVQDARQAREALTEAYDAAIKRIAELHRDVRDNVLDQRQAVLDLAAAKEELDRITANPRATQAEIEQARISYERRANQMTDLKDRAGELATAQAKADKDGVENAKEVRDARERIAKADERVADAQQKVGDAQQKVLQAMLDGQKRVAKAEQATADARRSAADQQIQSQEQIASAARGVDQAQRGVTQAFINSGVAGGDALDNLRDSFKLLSPEAQRFVKYLYSLKDAALGVRMAAERGMLPGFQSALRGLLQYVPAVERFVTSVGVGLGDIAQEAVHSLGHPVWRNFFGFINDTAVPALKGMWRFAEAVARGIASLIMNLSAFNKPIGKGLLQYAENFATWSNNLNRSKGFANFLEYVQRTGPKVVDLIKQLVTFAGRFVIAAAPIGEAVVGGLDLLLKILNLIPVSVLGELVLLIGGLSLALLLNSGIMRGWASLVALSTNVSLLWGRVQTGLAAINARYTATTTAAAASTGLLSRSLVAASAAGSAMAGRMSVLAATAGGPLVAALALATLGLVYLWQKYKSYGDDARQAAGGIGEMADEYERTGRVSRDFVRNLAATNPEARRQIQMFEDMGVSAEELARAYQGSAADMEKSLNAIDKRIEQLRKDEPHNIFSKDFWDLGANQDREDEIGRLTKLREETKKTGEENKKLSKIYSVSREEMAKFTADVNAASTSLADGVHTADQYKAGIAGVASMSAEAGGKSEVLAGIVARVADSNLSAAEKADLFDQALKATGSSATTSGKVFDNLAGMFTSIAKSEINAKDKADLLGQAMEQMYGAAKAQYDADEALVRSQQQLHMQLADNSAGFDLNTARSGKNTDAILANIDALKSALLATRDKYKEDIAAGVAEVDARKAHDDTVKSILNGIPASQRNTDAVKELNKRYGEIPPVKTTDVSTPGLSQAIQDLIQAHAIQEGLSAKPAWDNARIQQEANSLYNQVFRSKAFNDQGLGHQGGGKLAAGGPVPGWSPTPTADNIDIRATAGEYMQPVSAVDYYGVQGMEAIRQRRVPRQLLRGYAGGGLITRWPIAINAEDVKPPVTLEQLQRRLKVARAEAADIGIGISSSTGGNVGFPPWPRSPAASRGDSGVWRSIVALIRSTGPVSGSFGNAYRPGDPLWHGCVPLDTRILTRRGWITHNEIHVGEDETIGYNPATGKNEWTRIVGIHRYDDAELWTLQNVWFRAEVTPGHKWLVDQQVTVQTETACTECGREFATGRGMTKHRADVHGVFTPRRMRFEEQLVATRDFKQSTRIHLAKPADLGGQLPITDDEAELIGWIFADGYMEPYGPTIVQSKPEQVQYLKRFMARFPCSEYVRQPSQHQTQAVHRWKLACPYWADLAGRSKASKADALNFVLSLSVSQRAAFVKGFLAADGTRDRRTQDERLGYAAFQVSGPVAEAIKVAAYLEGYRPDTRVDTEFDKDRFGTQPMEHIGFRTPITKSRHLRIVGKRTADVWCPTTTLGTWTARQGEEIFLTGNSGRAVDWMGFNQDALATFLAGKRPLELIHRSNRRDYAFTRGRDRGSFNEALMQAHRNHVHIAMDEGGLLQPGWNPPIWNGTGAVEPVLNPGQWQSIERLVSQAQQGQGGGRQYHFRFNDTTLTPGRLRALQDRDDALARRGRAH